MYLWFLSLLITFNTCVILDAAPTVEKCSCFIQERSFTNDNFSKKKALDRIADIWLYQHPTLYDLEKYLIKEPERYIYVGFGEYSKLHLEHITVAKSLLKKYQYPQDNIAEFYPSALTKVCECADKLYWLYYKWQIAERNFIQNKKISHGLSTGRHISPNTYDRDITLIQQLYDGRYSKLQCHRKESRDLFDKLFSLCLNKHTSLRTYHELGFYHLKHGNNLDAMDRITDLIEHSKKLQNTQYLTSKTFEELGIACSFSLEYSQAVDALTSAISLDPQNKQAYLERAAAYFELGKFDNSIKDFIASENEPFLKLPLDPLKVQFALGFVKGAPKGLRDGALEMPSSLFYSLKGISQLLWAGISNPIGVPEKFIDSASKLIEYLRKEDPSEIAQHIAPELHALVTTWPALDHKTRGEKMGFVLGKYGVDVLCGYGGAKVLDAWKKLRQTNSICNLKTLTVSPKHNARLIQAAENASVQRTGAIGSKKLEMGKQGKHIDGHNNYKPQTLRDGTVINRSRWTHQDLSIIEKRQGTGRSCILPGEPGYIEPGLAGYKESVDFREIIGKYFEKETGRELETTFATIHYSKEGIHAVPGRPKGYVSPQKK